MTDKICYWDDEAKEQKERDATPEEQAEIDARKAPEAPEVIKARVWEEIKKYRDNLVENGGCKVGAHWYHSDVISRTRYIGLMMLGASIPAGLEWKTMENGYVPITQTWVQQVFGALFAQDGALMDAGKTHRAAMEASNDPANYDYKIGWPETYTGA